MAPRGKKWEQVDAVGRIGGIRCGAGGGKQGRQPVHADGHLVAGLAHRDARGPGDDSRDAQTSFEKLGFSASEWPRIGEAFPAVVAGEDDNRVVSHSIGVERLKDAADLAIQIFDHAPIRFLRATVEVCEPTVPETPGFCFVSRPFPRPVRRGEVQAEQEWLAGFGITVHHVDSVAAE